MNKRRLLKLAGMLEADAANRKGIKFDLTSVGYTSARDAELNCGTTACAMGLAAVSGAFKRHGLSYKLRETSIHCAINGRLREYKSAAKHTFGISRSDAFYLFSPLSYPDEKLTGAKGERYVAKRIRDFVAGKVAP